MRRPARGFSLIEVLLATSLLAAGMALAFLTLRSAGQATERARAVAAESERLRAVQAFLRRQLSGALPMAIEVDTATGEATLFEASRRELRFVAPMPGYLSRGGPYVQQLRLVPDRDGLRLEFAFQLLTPDGAAEAERPPEVLLRGVVDGAFEVRTLAPDGGIGPWLPEWQQPAQLPQLVRLRLQTMPGQAPFPDLVAALRLGASYGPSLPTVDEPAPDESGRATR